MARAARSAADVDAVLRALAEELLGALTPDEVHVLRIAADGEVASAAVARAGGDGEERYVQRLWGAPSGVGWVVERGEVLHVPDARHSAQLRQDHVERFKVGGALFVPLRAGEGVAAV